MKKVGIAIIYLGLILTFFTAINLVTKEKVVDIGDVQISRKKNNYLSWHPLYGVGVMVIGGAVYLLGNRKSRNPTNT